MTCAHFNQIEVGMQAVTLRARPAPRLWLLRYSISAILMRHDSERHFMSPRLTAPTPVPALRMLLVLVLALTVLAGCGQKGDLYRPGKTQGLAAISEVSSQV